MAELTHSQRQIRKEKKKARQAEQKYQETKDTEWLTKRDTHNDKVSELERNLRVNESNKLKKLKKKSDDEIMEECIRLNELEREEREKVQSEKLQKEQERKERRENAIKQRDIKQQEKEKYIESRKNMIQQLEGEKSVFIDNAVKDSGMTVSQAHKLYTKKQKVDYEYANYKMNVIEYMVSIGIDKEKAESDIEEAYNSEKEKISDIEECFQSFKKSFTKDIEFLGFRNHSIEVMVKFGGDQSKAEEEFDKNYEQYKSSHSSESKSEIYDGFSKEFTEKLEFLSFKYQTIQYLIKEKDMYPKQAIEEFEKIMEQMKNNHGSV